MFTSLTSGCDIRKRLWPVGQSATLAILFYLREVSFWGNLMCDFMHRRHWRLVGKEDSGISSSSITTSVFARTHILPIGILYYDHIDNCLWQEHSATIMYVQSSHGTRTNQSYANDMSHLIPSHLHNIAYHIGLLISNIMNLIKNRRNLSITRPQILCNHRGLETNVARYEIWPRL